VWKRDGGQCTFVSESGHRCEARRDVEWDHKLELARGGVATVNGIQLRCRAHNQLTAERTFGAGFMQAKREESRERAQAKRRRAVAAAQSNNERTASGLSPAEHAPGHVAAMSWRGQESPVTAI
jgi:hypothetical protein